MPEGRVAQLFRDADILDFLGSIGVARILAANLELGKEPAIKNSIKTMQALMQNLPKELSSNSAKIEGKKRLKEMKDFLNTLSAYTISGQAI